ncbi:hypothetical protein CRV08_07900 [Halarcobacter ebronensis]|uniref:HEPN AbiU2-like domain-containing protein n=1 Tax=Halarcobacter ebronensis TaxID=1462615 RepID=A0A4Q0YCP1_9BACT|nr:hypothetical protein [Halarcobacter ebronensis]RXJ68170.1 hypothetical protein CRV08_07900 [Halarcobacter ebronensis]
MKQIDFYIQETISQCEYAIYEYKQYKKSLKDHDIKMIFLHLHHFVLHSTSLDKMIFPHNNDFRKNIIKPIQERMSKKFKIIRKLRNHLEHFDERLDKYVKNYKGQAYFDCNLVTGAKGFPINNCLRALDGDNYIFYGEQFNIEEIYIELCNLLKILSTKNALYNIG